MQQAKQLSNTSVSVKTKTKFHCVVDEEHGCNAHDISPLQYVKYANLNLMIYNQRV